MVYADNLLTDDAAIALGTLGAATALQAYYPTVVRITLSVGQDVYQGSGVLIAPDEVLTASHLVWFPQYHANIMGEGLQITVVPGADGTSAPYGSFSVSNTHYFTIGDPNRGTLTANDITTDYAVLHLTTAASVGVMGIGADFPGGNVAVSGYPGWYTLSQQTISDTVSVLSPYSILGGATLGPGSSGGPVWTMDNTGGQSVVGIVSAYDPQTGAGYSCQITTPVRNQILAWLQQDSRAVIETAGVTSLTLIDHYYFYLLDASGTGPALKYQGAPVIAGQFGIWTPIAAEPTATGYQVAWKVAGGDQYMVWNTDAYGNYSGAGTAIVAGGNYTLEALEGGFQQDLNGDGIIGLQRRVIESSGVTELVQAADAYELDSGSGTGPVVKYGGSLVTVGLFGAWTPVGAEQTATGYQVAWKLSGSDQYAVWNTDASGNYAGAATGAVPGGSSALEALEPGLQQDLNGDGVIGVHSRTIESLGATQLVQIADQYELTVSGGPGPLLQYGGVPVIAGLFGAWIPIAAEPSASGYQIAWQLSGVDQYTVWDVDGNGNYLVNPIGTVPGASPVLTAFEPIFQQDLNLDGRIGPLTTIEAIGATSLVAVGNMFKLVSSMGTGPTLQYMGDPVLAGEFGGWMPIAAEPTPNGYQVAWRLSAGNLYSIWNTDATGTYTSSALGPVSGSAPALEPFETSLQQDLGGDWQVGVHQSPIIESCGGVELAQSGSGFQLIPTGGQNGPSLKYAGNPVTAGMFGSWSPIAAEQTANGYEVVWKAAGDQYTVWRTDANGNYLSSPIGVVSGSSPAILALEPGFQQDLNRDGRIEPTTTIGSGGSAKLIQVASQFEIIPNGGGTPGFGSAPFLRYQGNPVTVGEFGGWNPIGAAQSAAGYEIAWKLSGGDQYTVWDTGPDGNYIGSAIGVASGADFSLELLETAFLQDLNHDGFLATDTRLGTSGSDTVDLTGLPQTTTINLAGNVATASAGLSAPSLSFIGVPDAIMLGSARATVQYALAPTSGVETVTDFALGTDVLNIDLLGLPTGGLRAYDTSINGAHAVAIASSADGAHGVVLLGLPTGQTATDLLANHTTFVSGHALIGLG